MPRTRLFGKKIDCGSRAPKKKAFFTKQTQTSSCFGAEGALFDKTNTTFEKKNDKLNKIKTVNGPIIRAWL